MPQLFLPLVLLFAAILAWAGPAAGSGAEVPGGVHINGQRLSPAELDSLRSVIGSDVQIARYWYDPLSGWWGYEGGPVAGRIAPSLDLGGSLAPDASRGTTGVFINGREIPTQEWAWLSQRFVAVAPGRYWIDAAGLGGVEGGPATFDLRRLGPSDRPVWSNSNTGSSTGGVAEGTEWPGFRIRD